jgi:hypothetical protein
MWLKWQSSKAIEPSMAINKIWKQRI